MEELELSDTDGVKVNLRGHFRKIAWQFLKRLNTESQYEPTVPSPGVHPGEMGTHIYIKTCI